MATGWFPNDSLLQPTFHTGVGHAPHRQASARPLGRHQLLRALGLAGVLPALGRIHPLRRAALVGRLTTMGGQSSAYYVGLAEALGYAITISEFNEHSVNESVEHPIYGAAWNFAWQVNAALNTVTEFTIDGTVDDPLAAWGNALLECVINRLKPAQTTVLFSYT